MKKFMAILLAAMLTLSMIPMAAFAEEAAGDADAPAVDLDEFGDPKSGNFNGSAESPLNLAAEDAVETIGALFTTVGEVTRVAVGCPSWSDDLGSLTVTIWKWDTDYATTTGADAIQTKEFVDYKDNTFLGFDFEAPLAAGSYYIELSDAKDEGGGVGCWTGGYYAGQALFEEGVFVKDKSLRMVVNYASEITGNPYGTLPEFEKPELDIGGYGTKPSPEYIVMAEDDNALAFVEDIRPGTDNCQASVNEAGNLLLTIPAGTVDSQFTLKLDSALPWLAETISCSDYPVMALNLKILAPVNAGIGEAFLLTYSTMMPTPGFSTIIEYDLTTPEFQTITIDPTNLNKFNENADYDTWSGIRFDPIAGTPTGNVTVEIKWIAFFENAEAAKAFDGDFASVDFSTPQPTATPEATTAPTTAPTTEATTDTTDATDAPAKEEKGCGGIIANGAAVAVVMAAAIVLKKRRR